jgi:thymidine kinase
MPFLLAKANKVTKLTAVCTFKEGGRICGRDATRTQRYIDGKPADFDSPTVLIGDFNEGYEPHCIFHHKVNNMPSNYSHGPITSVDKELTQK